MNKMRRIVNSEEMKYVDSQTICHFGMPSLVLMERAALRIAENIPEQLSHAGRVLVVCGNGNNGADGLALARLLYQQGCEVTVAGLADNGKRTKENQKQREILMKYGLEIHEDFQHCGLADGKKYDCIVDALFGVGLSRPLQEDAADWVCAMNELPGYKVAVDMPSGVSSDTGRVCGAAFQADLTVTFAYQKMGQVFYPGCEKCGKLVIADIGITDESWLGRFPSRYALEQKDIQNLMHRPAYSNKGTFGKVLVIAGSNAMAGAAVFCAEAAYRMGCGLVKICTPEENRQILQTVLPEAVLFVYGRGQDEKFDEEGLGKALEWADSIALGPGLGTGNQAQHIVQMVLAQAKVPLVIDADALNILAEHLDWLAEAKTQVVVTPHLGEMARLCKKQISEIQEDLLSVATEFAEHFGVTCVLKDAVTVTISANAAAYFNTSGCSAMAKGGSGDVLTGMIASLLAQAKHGLLKLTDIQNEIAAAGVYIHGLAGEAAAEKKGGCSVLARDIIEAIGAILK